MKNKTQSLVRLCLCFLLLVVAAPGWSRCTRTGASQTEDGVSAIIPFGKINLASSYFFPPGAMLASVVVPPTNYTYGGATGASLLWECDVADLPNIYFLVATNGDDRVGGYYDIGAADGLNDVYATWFAYVGIRQTMAGVTLTRHWKKVSVTSYATSGTKVQIRLQDIPPLQAELYRISSLPGTSAASYYCGNNNRDGSGIRFASAAGQVYTCIQPNAYIQLAGDSNVSFAFSHDMPGEDSASHYRFWGADNGFGYGLRQGNKLYSNPTCVARSVTPFVRLPTLSVVDANAGLGSSAPFTLRVECDDNVMGNMSGVNDRQTALGFQVSEGAYSAAQSLGLVNADGGVSALVSDNYFSPGMAKGVGIYIENSRDPGKPMTFIGQPGLASLTPGGNKAGWYPVLLGAELAGSSQAGYSNYDYTFIATLRKLNNQTVKAGKVRATAYVLVKMQ